MCSYKRLEKKLQAVDLDEKKHDTPEEDQQLFDMIIETSQVDEKIVTNQKEEEKIDAAIAQIALAETTHQKSLVNACKLMPVLQNSFC